MTATGQIPVVCIVGATATGKTAVALTVCERIGGEIVGADSVQVYRGFDIGSGKPAVEALRGVAHHLIDVIDPDEAIDAARFAALADAAIADVHARGRVPVIVGGTGLWLRALIRGLVDVPTVDPEVRAQLEARWEQDGALAMHAYLRAVDPRSAETIHPNDKLRVVRALEVYEQTGEPMGTLREQHALGAPRYRTLSYLLQVPPVHLVERQRQRIAEMLDAGWIEETRALMQRYGANVRALSAVGYRQIVAHLSDHTPLEDTRVEIERATRVYARRQTTWFKSDRDVNHTLTPEALLTLEHMRAIESHLRRTP